MRDLVFVILSWLFITVGSFIISSIFIVLTGTYFINLLSQFQWFSNILEFIGG